MCVRGGSLSLLWTLIVAEWCSV